MKILKQKIQQIAQACEGNGGYDKKFGRHFITGLRPA
jgi:hypothetical protein